MTSRLDQLRAFLISRPHDPFVQYAIGIELKNAGQLREAEQAFAGLCQKQPEYVPTYYHYGQTLEALGEFQAAVKVYENGIERAKTAGDAHAASELQGALNLARDLM